MAELNVTQRCRTCDDAVVPVGTATCAACGPPPARSPMGRLVRRLFAIGATGTAIVVGVFATVLESP